MESVYRDVKEVLLSGQSLKDSHYLYRVEATIHDVAISRVVMARNPDAAVAAAISDACELSCSRVGNSELVNTLAQMAIDSKVRRSSQGAETGKSIESA